jgi:hypothetical protein
VAVEANLVLRRHAGGRRTDRGAVEDVDLGLDDVDARHLLGDGVLDLNARVDLDKIERPGIGIHQEFDGSCANIVGGPRDPERVVGQFLALRGVEIGRGRALHDLLVAPLDRTVALEQMHDIAMRVAQHLDLDMAGALDQLFQIDLVLAEGGAGLALGLRHLAGEIPGRADGAHAASAATPRGLEHDRIADRLGHPGDLIHIVGQRVGGWHDRHADLDGQIARGDLVAEPAHGFGFRADEDDAVGGTGLGEFRTFRQQAVAGVNGVGARQPGHANDLINRQIAFDRAEILGQMGAAADLVGFIGLEAVQGVFVLLGPDRDGTQIKFVGGAKDANRDFGPVGDEDLGYRQCGNPYFRSGRRSRHP